MTNPDDEQPAKRRPGRQPSGKPRDEILRAAQKSSRNKKSEEGLVAFRSFVRPETREYLHAVREALGVKELGQVLDVLAKSYSPEELAGMLKKFEIKLTHSS